MAEFDAVLFDFDGVLADTEPVHCACWAEALAPLGVKLDWAFFREHCLGVPDREMVPLLVGLTNPPSDWETLWERHSEKVAMFRKQTLESPPFPPELSEFLPALHARYKLAVVTASARQEIEPLLAAGGLIQHFDALVCGKEAGRHKPAPDPYLKAAEALGAVRPLVVEDSEPGIASARAAGFEVIQVTNAAETPEAVRRRLAL